ncbi:MAG: class I SAM-dependent methyltransferase, partial [Microbacterium sp.]
ALVRARAHAARLGLRARALFAQYDLGADFPPGRYDLVSAQFLHSPVAVPGERARILYRAARAVGPGGHLLVVSHWTVPSWHQGMPEFDHPVDLTLPSPEETRASLHLTDEELGEWETVRDDLVATELTGPGGQLGIREDHVLHVHRLEP